MIIDADTHMSPLHNFDQSINGVEWEQKRKVADIDMALAWLLPQEIKDVSESNRYIYEQSLHNPTIIPFGWVNIREGLKKAIQDVRQCILEFGFIGVKLNGAQNEYPIDCEDALTVCKEIASLGGMIAFHIGADSPDNTSPKRAEVVAKTCPDTIILMVHMGGAGYPDISDNVIETAKNNPNMFLIGSAIGTDKVANAIKELGNKRVLFGSDTPFADAKTVLIEYRTMLEEFDEKTAELVLGGNAKRIFSRKI